MEMGLFPYPTKRSGRETPPRNLLTENRKVGTLRLLDRVRSISPILPPSSNLTVYSNERDGTSRVSFSYFFRV